MPDPKQVTELVMRIAPMLAGHPAQVQGGALADLLAIWIAGHVAPGDPKATNSLREDLLTEHIVFVRQLIKVNAAAIHGAHTDGCD